MNVHDNVLKDIKFQHSKTIKYCTCILCKHGGFLSSSQLRYMIKFLVTYNLKSDSYLVIREFIYIYCLEQVILRTLFIFRLEKVLV